ncbi:hypothetical protein B0H13DRAFT_1919474 [Mycena leptocephala]|nr:hypothetical protein B0H13DRAFT_1919474 [Mycena leptocephala]
MSRHLPPCGLAGQTLAGYPAEVCMVIEQCTHNQLPTWNTASGLELCVSKYTKSVSDTRCLQILAASNTEQQPGITRLDRVIAASTAHHSHGPGSGSTCMGSWQMTEGRKKRISSVVTSMEDVYIDHIQLQIMAYTAVAILPTYSKSLAKTILLTINESLHCEFSNQLPQALNLRVFVTLEIPSSQTIWQLETGFGRALERGCWSVCLYGGLEEWYPQWVLSFWCQVQHIVLLEQKRWKESIVWVKGLPALVDKETIKHLLLTFPWTDLKYMLKALKEFMQQEAEKLMQGLEEGTKHNPCDAYQSHEDSVLKLDGTLPQRPTEDVRQDGQGQPYLCTQTEKVI